MYWPIWSCILVAMIPDRIFHIVGMQVFGWEVAGHVLLRGSFMISTNLPCISQPEWEPAANT